MPVSKASATIPVCLLLLISCGAAAAPDAASHSDLKKFDSPDTHGSVQFTVREGVRLDDGRPGLEFHVSGCVPGEGFSIYAVDVTGASLPLVPVESGRTADTQGEAMISVPYQLDGLHPGRWTVEVTGKPFARGLTLLVPKVSYPKGTSGHWSFDFRAAHAWDAAHQKTPGPAN